MNDLQIIAIIFVIYFVIISSIEVSKTIEGKKTCIELGFEDFESLHPFCDKENCSLYDTKLFPVCVDKEKNYYKMRD